LSGPASAIGECHWIARLHNPTSSSDAGSCTCRFAGEQSKSRQLALLGILGRLALGCMTANGTAIVNGEGRTLPVTAGRIADTCAANDDHIYEVDLAAASCP
jgi:hypothetical protein